MTALSGRASCGARSVLRALYGTVLAIIGLTAAGCGNSTFTYGTPVITFSATPGPFTTYLVQVYQIALVRDDGTVLYPLTVPEMVDLTQLNDRIELFGAPALIEGNYLSASITINYSLAQIYTNVNGTSQAVTILDASTGAAATTISYSVKFDTAHPLVIKRGSATPLDFNFDLSASSSLNTATSPMQLSVRPVMTASTQPVYRTGMRARGEYVTTDAGGSNFTVNSRAFFDIISSPKGAIQIQTDANTSYNINGLIFKGADGLTAMSKLSINSMVEAYGTLDLTALNSAKPTFKATEVYAGVAISNGLTARILGTVASRSGNTLHIHGAVTAQPILDYITDETLSFVDDLPVTLGASTLISVDGQPDANATLQNISVGQKVDLEGTVTFSTTGIPTSADLTTGLVRLSSTPVWGTLNTAGIPTLNLTSLGNYQPAVFTYTGTGSATGADSDPTAYVVTNSSATDLSGAPANSLVRFDGMVAPFGAAPPDFTATAAVLGANTDQVLVIDWVTGGEANPFVSVASDGITVNMSAATLGSTHIVQTGPLTIQTPATTVDLTNPLVNPKIVADPAITGQFAIGNTSTTGISSYHSYSSFQTQLSTVLNGTNKIQKLVAVGKWDGATFTAYRIDVVQLP